jgi:hypothetical protein
LPSPLTVLFGSTEILKCSFSQIKYEFNFLEGTTYGLRNNVQEKLAIYLLEYLNAFQSSKGFDDTSNEKRIHQFKRFVMHESEKLHTSQAYILTGVNLCQAD